MQKLRQLTLELVDFSKSFTIYSRRRLTQLWNWFEGKKDILVGFLVLKRGANQRPFLHTSFFVLVAGGIVAAPMIANTFPTVAVEQLGEFTPPSAVLTSFDDSTQTEISDKPRDTIISYKVESGDTLSRIADKFEVSVDSLQWANTGRLTDDKVVIGQVIDVPPVSGMVVKVKKGETIYSLAKKYQTEPQKIVNYPFNDFTDLDTFALTAGQTLVLPDAVMPETPAALVSPRLIAQVGVTKTGSGQFLWPTQGKITQRPVSYHMAVDIANNALPPIQAADSGKVVLVEYAKYGYGHHVMIDHGNGFQTLYGHMSEIYVTVGQNVSKGQVIGRMGSTGRSSGSHLHFEIRKSGVLLNPLNFLQ